jgi:hypothetical protein
MRISFKGKLFLILIFLFNLRFAHADAIQSFVYDSKNDLLVVVSGGLAGAVLGLSTLSFVDQPRLHTRNILVGASFGIIIGVIYVAMNQANRSREMFEPADEDYSFYPQTFDETWSPFDPSKSGNSQNHALTFFNWSKKF